MLIRWFPFAWFENSRGTPENPLRWIYKQKRWDPRIAHPIDYFYCLETTPLKTNMEPQNGGLEDDFPFQRGDFQVLC